MTATTTTATAVGECALKCGRGPEERCQACGACPCMVTVDGHGAGCPQRNSAVLDPEATPAPEEPEGGEDQ